VWEVRQAFKNQQLAVAKGHPMKVLAICGAIRLPDDFNGTMADAWALYGEHVVAGTIANRHAMTDEEAEAKTKKAAPSGAEFFAGRAVNKLIDEMRPEDGPKHKSYVTFSEMMPNGTWLTMDVNQTRRRLKVVRG